MRASAVVQDRYLASSTGGPLESARIRCPRGHWFDGPIEFLTWDKHRRRLPGPGQPPVTARARLPPASRQAGHRSISPVLGETPDPQPATRTDRQVVIAVLGVAAGRGVWRICVPWPGGAIGRALQTATGERRLMAARGAEDGETACPGSRLEATVTCSRPLFRLLKCPVSPAGRRSATPGTWLQQGGRFL